MKAFWDSRYEQEAYAFGTQPNRFFREILDQIEPVGRLLLPAEGEGRNAVYAAGKGWEVTAFDISAEGKKKALKLAEAEGVAIRYLVGELPDLDLGTEAFDCAALIYAHFPPGIRAAYHRLIAETLRPGGQIILEGFCKDHLAYRQRNPQVGGPGNEEMLFSMEELKQEFAGFELLRLEETEVELSEGAYHRGVGKVVRMVGRKKPSLL